MGYILITNSNKIEPEFQICKKGSPLIHTILLIIINLKLDFFLILLAISGSISIPTQMNVRPLCTYIQSGVFLVNNSG